MNQKRKKLGLLIMVVTSIIILQSLQVKGAWNYIEPYKETVDSIKEKAYTVLNNKCNICHRKQNPFKIFSLRNMDRYAQKIEEQVFILKRMPKGNEIKLTNFEKESLQNWLETTIKTK
jgi:uncharacterized membrane protein